jgi:hypothetical protein
MTEVAEMQCRCGMKMPEDIAYNLMIDIARSEKIVLGGDTPNSSRKWILLTYSQCLQAVRNPADAATFLAAYTPPTG